MIKTKSVIYHKKIPSDGTRICVMRFVRETYDYDEWLQDLAPSIGLLNDIKSNRIIWSEYKERYLEEMKDQRELIESLKKRSDDGETITLLCWERNDKYCHRKLLKNLIEKI